MSVNVSALIACGLPELAAATIATELDGAAGITEAEVNTLSDARIAAGIVGGGSIDNAIDALLAVAAPVSVNASVSAASTDQAGATAISAALTVVTLGYIPEVQKVCAFQRLERSQTAGNRLTVFNDTTHPIKLYPATGGSINGLAANAPIFIRGGGSVSLFLAAATVAWAVGEEISSVASEWIHLRTTFAASTTIATIFTRAVAEQVGLSVDGRFFGSYVGKSAGANMFSGTFTGSASRSAGGTAQGGFLVSSEFQDIADAVDPIDFATVDDRIEALVDSSLTPPQTLTASARNTSTLGTYRATASATSVNDSAVIPFVRTNLASNDLILQSRGIATDTVQIYVSFRLRTLAGQ